MQIVTRLDGYVATPDGRPSILALPSLVPGESHGFPEFQKGIEAVAMGRTTFLPALGSLRWPRRGFRVFVLTSSALPPGRPRTSCRRGPAGLVERIRAEVTATSTSSGLPLTPPGIDQLTLRLEREHTFPDGAVELVYSPAS